MVRYALQNRNPAHSSSNQSHGCLLPALQPSFCAPMRPARRLEVYAAFCCILCSGSSFLVTKKRLGSSILQIFMANAAPKLTRAVHTTCRTKKRQGQGAPRLQTNLATLQRETCPHMFQLTKRSCPPFSAPLQPCMTWRSQSSSHGPEHTGRSNGGLPSGEKPKSAYVILSHATYGVIQFHSKSYRQY